MDYYQKYIKYKQKYLELKDSQLNNNIQIGGADKIVNKCVTKTYNIKCVNDSKLPLKTHQKKLVKHIMTHRGLLAIHAVGSGKTLSAVTSSQCFLKKYPNKRVIIVTPKSLQENFTKEMLQYNSNIDTSKYSFYTIDGFMIAKQNGEINCDDVMLIIDEAHNLRSEIKNDKGKKALYLINCAKEAFKVLLLSATPIINRPYDLVNLISMIDGTDNLDKKDFGEIFDDPDKFRDYFSCKISIFQPDIKETKIFYPKSKINEIFIPMTTNYENKYVKVEQDIGFSQLFENPKTFYNGVRRASNKIDDDINAPKIVWIRNFFTKNKNGKCVIFSHWLESGIMTIMKILDEYNISYKYIDGSLSKKERKEAVKEYNLNLIRVLLISKAGGEGLDLKETRYMILLEPGWNPAITEQVIGRGIRFKSHYHLPKSQQIVNVYKLYLVKQNEKNKINKYIDIEKARKSKKKWSVDLYLRALALSKKIMIDDMMKRLKSYSIENNKKCDC